MLGAWAFFGCRHPRLARFTTTNGSAPLFAVGGGAVEAFLQVVSGLIFGVLSGYDRLMFRGHLRELGYTGGVAKILLLQRIIVP